MESWALDAQLYVLTVLDRANASKPGGWCIHKTRIELKLVLQL
jgi:hypothetical protein